MQKRVILIFRVGADIIGTKPVIVSAEDEVKLGSEVQEYNKQIIALKMGTAAPVAYNDAKDRMMLAAVASGKKFGPKGAGYPQWCYEGFDWEFELVEVDSAWTPEKELPKNSDYYDWALDGTFGEGELSEILATPFDSSSESSPSIGYGILPMTQSAFSWECTETKMERINNEKSAEAADKSESIPDDANTIIGKKEKITKYLCACNERRFNQRIGYELVDFPPDEIKCTLPFDAFIKLQGPATGEIQESITDFLKQACGPSGVIPKVTLKNMIVYPCTGQHGDPGARNGKVIYREIPYELLLKFLKTLLNRVSPQITLYFRFRR